MSSYGVRFRDQLADFLRFVLRPSLAPRLSYRSACRRTCSDWLSGIKLGRLIKWALFLWTVNLVVLGPIAVSAATAGGAQHRLDISAIPWFQALLWAPIIEEMVFRYGLRRYIQALWLLPVALVIMFSGPTTTAQLSLVAILLFCWWPSVRGEPRVIKSTFWAYGRLYSKWFPYVFHISCLAFAAVHLYNFNLKDAPLALLPLLVLPQWLTGMVLAWMRVRYGIGLSIALHALFNSGPLFVVWLILRMVPDMASM